MIAAFKLFVLLIAKVADFCSRQLLLLVSILIFCHGDELLLAVYRIYESHGTNAPALLLVILVVFLFATALLARREGRTLRASVL